MSKTRKSVAALAAFAVSTLALGGCSMMNGLLGPDQVLKVDEVGRALDCAAPSADSTVQMFAGADAVLAWQQTSGIQLIGDQAMLPGTYVLVGLGQRPSGGYGLLIGPEAQVEDQRVQLRGTFFEPDAHTMDTTVINSPCVLVRLPAGDWQGVDIYDQSGKRRARTAAP